MFLGPLMHREDVFELPYAGGCDLGTRTVEPHMAALRPFGLEVKATEGSYHATVNRARLPDPADRADRARRHRHRERPAGRRPPRRRHGDPQRQPQLHGPGPLLLPREARRADRRHRHHHADRPRPPRHRRRRRLRAVGGPDRGDVAAGRRDRHRVRDHHPPGADRVPRDRARAARGDGLPLRPQRGVRRRQRAHPAGRHRPRCVSDAALPHRQDPPDAVPGPQHRQPAVLRGHRRRGRGPDAAARLGLREPRDLPHRAHQARRLGQAARPAPGADRGPDPLVAAPRSSARRRCVRPW